MAFPSHETLVAGKPHWLIDNKRTGYYVHPESPPLVLTRRPQQWNYLYQCWAKPEPKFPEQNLRRDPRNYEPTTGDFATAWFLHGVQPAVTACVYSLFPEAAPENMQRIAQQMKSPETALYVILQKDARAHILHDRASRTTGHILFQSGVVQAAGKLRSVNRPCSVMLREDGDRLRLSVASTDLDDWPTAANGKVLLSGDVVLTLDRRWSIGQVDAVTPRQCQVRGSPDKTTLSVPFKDFMPVRITLMPE